MSLSQSDRKASQILGVTVADTFQFRRHHRSTSPDHSSSDSEHSFSSSSSSSDLFYDDSDSENEDDFVWDVPNPFAPLDPSQARLHALMQAEIARMRRYETIGPLQSLPVDANDSWDESESEDTDDEGHEGDDDDAADADDEDSSDEDTSKPNTIVLPKLFHAQPLCFTPSPHPSPSPSPPPPTPSVSSFPWADLAQTYNNIAEAEERARKAKRDLHRSRLKALAVLGHEASSAI